MRWNASRPDLGADGPRSVSRVIGTMFEDARNIGLVETNPFSNLRLPATEKRGRSPRRRWRSTGRCWRPCTVLGGYGQEFRAMIKFAAWSGIGRESCSRFSGTTSPRPRITISEVAQARRDDRQAEERRDPDGRLLPPASVLDDVPRAPRPVPLPLPRGKPLLKGTPTGRGRR